MTTNLPTELAEQIANRHSELDAALAKLGGYGLMMLAATAHTALQCPRCNAGAGWWCTSNRRGHAGQPGYSNCNVQHKARRDLVDDWDEDTKIRASAIAGVARLFRPSVFPISAPPTA
jgi:hypothetical protein